MKKILNFLMYGKYDRETFVKNKDVIDYNNYIRLKVFCYISLFINSLLFLLSFFGGNLHRGSYLYLVMMLISILYIVLLSFYFKSNKKHITLLFYIYIIISLLCFETLDVNFNLNLPASLITMMYLLSAYLFLDMPLRYDIALLLFSIYLCFDAIKLKAPDVALIDCTNCLIVYSISCAISHFQFNERIGKVMALQATKKERDTDYLTGLRNRISTEKDITEILTNSKKISVMMIIDLDDFKSINDTYGHKGGDKVLQSVAVAMRSCFRKDDYVSRIGGDEFTVFLTNIPSENFAIDKAKLLISKINEIELKKGNFVGCSVGLAFSTTDKSYDQLFKKADTALYEAKSAGKNIYKVYEK